MNLIRYRAITGGYSKLHVAVVGDFCLDRYFEIDPARSETSLETGLPVHNVTHVRCQPGGAGTIVNNLAALGLGRIDAVGIAGEDGEGWELRRALGSLPQVALDHFLTTPLRKTFTYSKPLLIHSHRPPEELNRLDIKNWSPTPATIEQQLGNTLTQLVPQVDALILLEQVDLPNTGVITETVLARLHTLTTTADRPLIVADSRRGLSHFPPFIFKMNRAELGRICGTPESVPLAAIKESAAALARKNRRPVFVTLAEDGLLGANPQGAVAHRAALPTRGEIDIVGAGDAVTANLTAALAAGATLEEALELANAAASIVIHQLGTTGTANVEQIETTIATNRQ